MRLSAFAPLGLLRLTGKPSGAEAIYRAMRDALGADFAEGGHAEASVFARAMGMARAHATLERARSQHLPNKVTDLLPAYEAEYGLSPAKTDSVLARRAALARARHPSEPGTRAAIERALSAALGSDFLAYQPLAVASYPAVPENGPGLFVPKRQARKIGTLPYACVGVTDAGGHWQKVPLWVSPVAGLEPACTFAFGDAVVMGPDNGANAAKHILTTPPDGSGAPFGVYAQTAHEAGTVVVSQRWPYWIGQSRRARIVVTAKASGDPRARASIANVMRRYARATSQWDVVVTTTGFVLDQSPLDTTTL